MSTTWSENSTPASACLGNNKTIWVPELSLFVAVGNGSVTADRSIMTSPDGATWTKRTTPTSSGVQWSGVAWSPPLTRLVAVSIGGTDRVATSSDGITWTARTASSVSGWIDVTWSDAINRFIAVALSGTDRVMTSQDGINWISKTASAASSWSNIISPNPILVAAAGGAASTTNRVMTCSDDGSTWISRTLPVAGTFGVAQAIGYSADLGQYVLVGQVGGAIGALYSPDAINWTQSNAFPAGWSGNSISAPTWIPEASTWIAFPGGVSSAKVLTSPDGITWSVEETGQTAKAWYSAAYAQGLGRVVSVSLSSSATFALSGDVLADGVSPDTGNDSGDFTVTITNAENDFSGLQNVAFFYPSQEFGFVPSFSTHYTQTSLEAIEVAGLGVTCDVVSASSVTCTPPPGSGHGLLYGLGSGAVSVDVMVFDFGVSEGTPNLKVYLPAGFTYIDPVLTSLDVITGPVTGGTAIVLTGTQFYPVVDGVGSAHEVYFGGALAFATFVNATTMNVTTPASFDTDMSDFTVDVTLRAARPGINPFFDPSVQGPDG